MILLCGIGCFLMLVVFIQDMESYAEDTLKSVTYAHNMKQNNEF